MPRKKDAELHASLAKDQVFEAYKLVRDEWADAQERARSLMNRRDDLLVRLEELRAAAKALGITEADLDN